MNWGHLRTILWLRWRMSLNQLRRSGIASTIILAILATIVVLSSISLFFIALFAGMAQRRRAQLRGGSPASDALADLIPPDERSAPIVTVQDGASHALSFLGSAFGVPVIPLGVDSFGQSGIRADLYRTYNIDRDAIVAAAFLALDERG